MEREYLKWREGHNLRASQAEFAEYLGISAPVLSFYLNGRKLPADNNIRLLASRLGLEIYEILGLQNPNPDLAFICHYWGKLSTKQKRFILERIKDYLIQGEGE